MTKIIYDAQIQEWLDVFIVRDQSEEIYQFEQSFWLQDSRIMIW